MATRTSTLFTDDAIFEDESAGRRLVGHNALRADLLRLMQSQEQVEFTVERHWVVAPTVFASWHASYVEPDRSRAGPRRGLPGPRAGDRRSHRAPS